MTHIRGLLLVLIVSLILMGCSTESENDSATAKPTDAPPVSQTSDEPIRILRLDSYHVEFPWSTEITRGVVQGLADHGYEVDGEKVILDEYFMDTKRNTSQEYFDQIAADTIAYIEETQPDVVIASDDNAAALVVQPMRSGSIPFVVLGLNGQPEAYEFDEEANVTAVLERPHINAMLEWIQQVIGVGTRISILAEDSPTTGRMFGDGVIQRTIEDSPLEFISMNATNDFEAWQNYVREAADTSDVLFLGAYAALHDADGNAVEAVATLRWTLENSEIPVMGFWEEAVHEGTVGGSVISGYVQGYESAERAVAILDGTPSSEIPHSAPPRGKLIINQRAIDKWGIQVPLDLLEVSEVVP